VLHDATRPLGSTGASCALSSTRECYKQSKERATFLGRVWCALSLHLGIFQSSRLPDKWINLTPLTVDVYHSQGSASGLTCGASLAYVHCSIRRKISLPTRFVKLESKSSYQGIYPTVIFVVATMRMSAADILSQLPPETHHHSSTMIFTPPSPTSRPSTLAMTVGSSSDNDFFVESREDVSTRILASSDPEKGGGLSGHSGQDMWHD
jgi:hypothetical protein